MPRRSAPRNDKRKQVLRVAKVKRKRCGCGELYEPQHDKICPVCRYFLRALRSKDVFFVEQMRAEYIKRYGKYLSYGQFVAKLEQIERRRTRDSKRKKGST